MEMLIHKSWWLQGLGQSSRTWIKSLRDARDPEDEKNPKRCQQQRALESSQWECDGKRGQFGTQHR